MPDEDNKILKYNPREQSLKATFIIYADLECLPQKINSCQSNTKKSYTEKKAEHVPSVYSILACRSFDKFKNERKYYRGEDCMIFFCKDLKEEAMKIINIPQKPMTPLTDKEKETHENQRVCYLCKKILIQIKKVNIIKIIKKLEIIVIIQANIE